MKSVTILGSTGSIGTQALDVVRRNPDRFKVVGLSAAGANQELLVGQVREFLPPHVAIADEQAAADVKAKIGALPGVEVIVGPDAAEPTSPFSTRSVSVSPASRSAASGPTITSTPGRAPILAFTSAAACSSAMATCGGRNSRT